MERYTNTEIITRMISARYMNKKININLERKVLIVIHLFYLDTMMDYVKYVEMIPKNIDVLFTCTSEAHKKMLKEIFVDRDNCFYVSKKNRGRDISALLVTAKEYIFKYDYVCFLHDKKEVSERVKGDTEKWKKSLWDNMIGTENTIYNCIALLESDEKIGLIVPPAPLGETIPTAVKYAWGINFENTYNLAEKLELLIRPNKNIEPKIIGTVFWARVDSLNKLLNIDWNYEDFPEEPLMRDGTINHAVERILPFVVEDAGYKTVVAMNEESMENRVELLEHIARNAISILVKENPSYSYQDIYNYKKQNVSLEGFLSTKKNVYIYGAGYVSKLCIKKMELHGRSPSKIFVSQKEDVNFVEGIEVVQWGTVQISKEDGLIVAVGVGLRDEVIKYIFETNRSLCVEQVFVPLL